MTTSWKHSLAVLAALGLAACGGGAGGTSPQNPGGGGTPGTANLSLKGAITAQTATSVTVNGVTVSTSSATTRVEHAVADDSALRPGMVVKVKAHRNGGGTEAEGLEIEFEHDLKGKVSAKDAAAGTLTVGGQTVRIDDSTHFEDNLARLGSISAGTDRVRVSGVTDDRGGLRASRVDRVSGTDDSFEVKGVVSDLTATGFTLTSIGGTVFTVTLAAGASIPAGLANGGYAEVHAAAPPSGTALVAASIQVEDRLPGLPNVENEVEGIVTAGASGSFTVNGTTVVTDASTRWDGGVPADLVIGVKVEAEGVLASDGTLAADKVKFKDYIKLQGAVGSLAVDGAGLGTLVVNGVSLRTDNLTRQDDPVASLADGAFVEVRGQLARDGVSVVVTRIRDRSSGGGGGGGGGGSSRPIIQGLVTAVSGDTLTILGKSVSITSALLRNYRVSDASDGPTMSKADFLAAITPGQTVVKARGADLSAFVDPNLTAEEAELEGER